MDMGHAKRDLPDATNLARHMKAREKRNNKSSWKCDALHIDSDERKNQVAQFSSVPSAPCIALPSMFSSFQLAA
jgi:hypothetical protein